MNPPGFYVHVPFCDGKCGYCAFYSVRYDPALADRYLDALGLELELLRTNPPCDEPVMRGGFRGPDTVYFGGGTPTILSADRIERLCGIVVSLTNAGGGRRGSSRRRVPCEWTVEVNPGTITPEKLDVLRRAGVNRISLGAQSFDDPVLRRLGRRHSALDTRDAVEMIRGAGFRNLGLDLIACIPGVDKRKWRGTLEDAVSMKPEHISVYALTVEEGTALEAMTATGRHRVQGDAAQLAALHLAGEVLGKAGYGRYEISNYALPGLECRHNLACWRGEEYIGIGPAASSHAGRLRWTNIADSAGYLAALEKRLNPPREFDRLSDEVKATEMIVFGLRMSEGIDPAAVRRKSGISAAQEKKLVALLRGLSESGLVRARNKRWILTDTGRDLADFVAVELTGWETESPVH